MACHLQKTILAGQCDWCPPSPAYTEEQEAIIKWGPRGGHREAHRELARHRERQEVTQLPAKKRQPGLLVAGNRFLPGASVRADPADRLISDIWSPQL